MSRKYKSVQAMIDSTCEDKSFKALFKRELEEHSVGKNLFVLRCKFKKVFGMTKSSAERIEGSKNSDLSMAEVGNYLEGLVEAMKGLK